MSSKLISRTGSEEATSHHAILGSPCWVSLAARDLSAAESFYGAVLGWTFRAGTLGERFVVALAQGRAVAGIGAVAPALQVPVAWTPYFAVADADETVGRVQERGGTVGVGPIGFPTGRAALVSDRAGAVFGIWAGALVRNFGAWRRDAPCGCTSSHVTRSTPRSSTGKSSGGRARAAATCGTRTRRSSSSVRGSRWPRSAAGRRDRPPTRRCGRTGGSASPSAMPRRARVPPWHTAERSWAGTRTGRVTA